MKHTGWTPDLVEANKSLKLLWGKELFQLVTCIYISSIQNQSKVYMPWVLYEADKTWYGQRALGLILIEC